MHAPRATATSSTHTPQVGQGLQLGEKVKGVMMTVDLQEDGRRVRHSHKGAGLFEPGDGCLRLLQERKQGANIVPSMALARRLCY